MESYFLEIMVYSGFSTFRFDETIGLGIGTS